MQQELQQSTIAALAGDVNSYGKYQVHLILAHYPMMSEIELRLLAADIAEHGLLLPIVLAADGVTANRQAVVRGCHLGRQPVTTSSR